jgi:hypothetical protein
MQLSRNYAPTKLLHCLQGWPPDGPNRFRWIKDQLIFMLPREGVDICDWDVAIIPTSNQWQEFWQVCDEVGVWSWPPTNEGLYLVRDGLQWDLELQFGNRHVVSQGQVTGTPRGFWEKLMRLHESLQAMTEWQKIYREM